MTICLIVSFTAVTNMIPAPIQTVVAVGTLLVDSLHGISSQLADNEWVIGDETDVYRVFCWTNTTMKFIFVKSPTETDWHHCHTANTVNIDQIHFYAYTVYDGINENHIESRTPTRNFLKTSTRHGFRLTDAIANYRNGNYIYDVTYDIVTAHDMRTEFRGEEITLYNLPVKNAVTIDELVY